MCIRDSVATIVAGVDVGDACAWWIKWDCLAGLTQLRELVVEVPCKSIGSEDLAASVLLWNRAAGILQREHGPTARVLFVCVWEALFEIRFCEDDRGFVNAELACN